MASDTNIPWRSVLWAIGLLILGLTLFIAGLVLWAVEHVGAFKGLALLGSLVFIPGAYYTRMAYLIHKRKGYRGWDDFPVFQEWN
ncbi:hypothetical protein H632_c4423p0 [Helicosporidium sp. ATCC 50920]|nr:hypothetical protein H632_c4423p0 [Helicosporidium sp. ATCC 50920]|eukprot:KDD71776.1 hypothetical protein H632_c4423p0 [Helicosporidium sp. ATCC 50920]